MDAGQILLFEIVDHMNASLVTVSEFLDEFQNADLTLGAKGNCLVLQDRRRIQQSKRELQGRKKGSGYLQIQREECVEVG